MRHGPAYTELALFARLEADETLRFVNLDYVIKRGADPHAFKKGILRMLND